MRGRKSSWGTYIVDVTSGFLTRANSHSGAARKGKERLEISHGLKR